MLRHENANLLDQNKTAFILNLVNLTDNFRRSLLPNLSTNNYKANISKSAHHHNDRTLIAGIFKRQ